MNGIIIFVGICVAILLYLWALTQSHCNDNEKKIVHFENYRVEWD